VQICALLYGGANVLKLDALHCRTGFYGICMLVRGDRSMNAHPIVAKTGEIDKFFEETTNKTIVNLLEDLDAWCVGGLKGKNFQGVPYILLPKFYRTRTREKEHSGKQEILSESAQTRSTLVINLLRFTELIGIP